MGSRLPRRRNNFRNISVLVRWLKSGVNLRLSAECNGSYVMIDNDPYHGQ